MMLRQIVGLPAALAFMTVPVAAQAESCYALQSQDNVLKQRALELATDNPGTALVVAGCVGMATSSYESRGAESDAVSAFVTCAAFGCGLTDSYRNCISVGSQLIILAVRGSAIEDRMRQQGCAL